MRTRFALTFTLEGSELIWKRGNSISELKAESDTEFYCSPIDSVIKFVRDDKGAVDHITLSINDRPYTAPRQK